MFSKKEVRILMVDFVGFEKTVKVMSYAKGLASLSKDPIAVAIANLDSRIETAKVEKVKEFKDFGIEGRIGNERVILGNEKIMQEKNIKLNGDTSYKIYLAIDGNVQAVFRIDD